MSPDSPPTCIFLSHSAAILNVIIVWGGDLYWCTARSNRTCLHGYSGPLLFSSIQPLQVQDVSMCVFMLGCSKAHGFISFVLTFVAHKREAGNVCFCHNRNLQNAVSVAISLSLVQGLLRSPVFPVILLRLIENMVMKSTACSVQFSLDASGLQFSSMFQVRSVESWMFSYVP